MQHRFKQLLSAPPGVQHTGSVIFERRIGVTHRSQHRNGNEFAVLQREVGPRNNSRVCTFNKQTPEAWIEAVQCRTESAETSISNCMNNGHSHVVWLSVMFDHVGSARG